MKSFVLGVMGILFLITNAQADICHNVNQEIASKAISVIKDYKEIFEYCSLCENAKPRSIKIEKISYDGSVYVNGKPIDLAYIYYQDDSKYINLGVDVGCIKEGTYGISAKLDNLTEFQRAKETDKEQAKQKAEAIFNECIRKVENDKYKTTQDMIERNVKINNCLSEAIKQEIRKGFNPQQQPQMLEYFEQTRKGIWNFYHNIYATNKYCYGQCGSITSLLPYSNEGLILMQMLESLLYLNIAKNGY